jgi:hypothetical protein
MLSSRMRYVCEVASVLKVLSHTCTLYLELVRSFYDCVTHCSVDLSQQNFAMQRSRYAWVSS